MSNLLDDTNQGDNAAERLAQVRVLALAFLAKCLVDLFARLQLGTSLFEGGDYVLWVVLGGQVICTQYALYALYSCKDKRLLGYLRLFYISLGVFFVIIALLYSNWELDVASLRMVYSLVLLLLDAAMALLLIRYHYKAGKRPHYWLFMEELVLLCLGVFLLYFLLFYLLYTYYLRFLGTYLMEVILFFQVALLLLAFWRCFLASKRVARTHRVLLWLSMLAVVSWKSGINFDFGHRQITELLLFAATTLGVLAYALSSAKDLTEEVEP